MKKEKDNMITRFKKLFEQDTNLEDIIIKIENEKKEFHQN